MSIISFLAPRTQSYIFCLNEEDVDYLVHLVRLRKCRPLSLAAAVAWEAPGGDLLFAHRGWQLGSKLGSNLGSNGKQERI